MSYLPKMSAAQFVGYAHRKLNTEAQVQLIKLNSRICSRRLRLESEQEEWLSGYQQALAASQREQTEATYRALEEYVEAARVRQPWADLLRDGTR